MGSTEAVEVVTGRADEVVLAASLEAGAAADEAAPASEEVGAAAEDPAAEDPAAEEATAEDAAAEDGTTTAELMALTEETAGAEVEGLVTTTVQVCRQAVGR